MGRDVSSDSKLERPPTSFYIDISEDKLDTILRRVRNFPWDSLAAPADGGDWRYGPPPSYMRDLCTYWADGYSWRAHERTMNAVPQFLVKIGSFDLHFVHERGSGPAPRPLLIMHGWPYSFHSYNHLIDRLAHPERFGGRVEDAFTVVIPSLPGYAFSGCSPTPMSPSAMATILNTLMVDILNYPRYVAHGGDWGAIIADILGFTCPEQIVGLHLTTVTVRAAGEAPMSGLTAPGASTAERAFAVAEADCWRREGAYSRLQSTKPLKLAYSMADSPVGVAAWIVEAFHAWSDLRASPFEALFSRDQLLTEIMLYLVTDAFTRRPGSMLERSRTSF